MRCAMIVTGPHRVRVRQSDNPHPDVELRYVRAEILPGWRVEGFVPLCPLDSAPAFVTVEMFVTRRYIDERPHLAENLAAAGAQAIRERMRALI